MLNRQAVAIIEQALGPDFPAVAEPLWRIGQASYDRRDYAEGGVVFRRLAAMCRQQFGSGDPRTAASESKVAAALIDEGRYADAEALLEPALEVYEKNFGRSHPEVAYILDLLGEVATLTSRYDDAVTRFRRALSIRRRDRKGEGLAFTMGGLAQALTGQAAALSNQGSLVESEAIFTEALDLVVAAVGPKGALTGTVLGGIAWAKTEQGLYRRAEELYRQQYDIYMETREHTDAIFSVRPHGIVQAAVRLGGVLVEEAQFDEARKFLTEALEMSEQLPDVSDDWYGPGQILGRLARLELRLGHFQAADEFAARSAALFESGHPGLSVALDTQAEVGDARGRCQEAYRLLLRARSAVQDAVGVDDTDAAWSLISVGYFGVRHEGLRDEAESAFREAIRIRERQFGPQDPSVAWALIGLAESCRRQRPNDARPLLQRALEIFDARHGGEYPDAAEALTDLAEILIHEGELAEAERLLDRAQRVTSAAFGDAHPALAYVLIGVGHLHLHAGREAQAVAAWQQSLRITEEKLGPNNPELVDRLDVFEEGLRELGRLREADDLRARADRIRIRHARIEPGARLELPSTRRFPLGNYAAPGFSKLTRRWLTRGSSA